MAAGIEILWPEEHPTASGLSALERANAMETMLDEIRSLKRQLFVGALSLATAMFLILEMNDPMSGVIKSSSGPMRKALEHLGQ